jgi:hypothetical protein
LAIRPRNTGRIANPSHGQFTSTFDEPKCRVMVSTALHPAAVTAEQLARDCRLRRCRRTGPGGQHRNKVETAVVLTHVPSGIRGEASERRSPEENRVRAMFRLRINLALELRCPHAPADGPSALWQARVRSGRISISPAHEDFPALLAEALDVLHACGMDAKTAAERLTVTPSQLVRLLQLEPRALHQVNARRTALGRKPLR